jgi:hypothetical protein
MCLRRLSWPASRTIGTCSVTPTTRWPLVFRSHAYLVDVVRAGTSWNETASLVKGGFLSDLAGLRTRLEGVAGWQRSSTRAGCRSILLRKFPAELLDVLRRVGAKVLETVGRQIAVAQRLRVDARTQ